MTRTVEGSREEASLVLDALHEAASCHDGERYFGLYAPDSVYLGTDPAERWTLEEFKRWAVPYFNSGRGWTYTKNSRFVGVSADMDTAWFDESLQNEKYGECRGTGVLVKIDDEWKIMQYNLTIPVPNGLVGQLLELMA